MAKYGSQANAHVEQDGFVHEGWVTGAILGQLMGDSDFGQPADYKGY